VTKTIATSQGIKFFEKSHRYKIDGQWAVGVTTALKGIPKPALVKWSANEVARWAVENIWTVKRVLDDGGFGPAFRMLSEIPNQKRDSAAVRGVLVHEMAEKYIRDEEIELAEDDPAWPYIRAYAAYINDFNPTSLHEELTVANREHMYAGRLDSIQDVPSIGVIQVDYKTGKGVYGEHALQCTAYEHAEVYVDADGNEQPMPKLAGSYVLHIKPDDYDLIPAETGDDAFTQFLTALANYRQNVQSNKLDGLLGMPVIPPRAAA
jgi:hypothetical protein